MRSRLWSTTLIFEENMRFSQYMKREQGSLSKLHHVLSSIWMTDFPKIARRYFVMNFFDGLLTMLGFVAGYYLAGGRNPALIVSAGLAASAAMGVSGFTGALLTEYAERQREVEELEKAMLRDLSSTILSRAQKAAAFIAAFIDAVAPALGALLVALPLTASAAGLLEFDSAVAGSLALGFAALFILGIFLSKVAGGAPLRYGLAMVASGVVVLLAALLLGGA